MYFETNICDYNNTGRPIKTGDCWSLGRLNKEELDKINIINISDTEILYNISLDIEKTTIFGGCTTVGGDILITNKGQVIKVESTELCSDY